MNMIFVMRQLSAASLIATVYWSSSLLVAQTTSRSAPRHASVTRVPFVPCKSDGQVGPLDGPAEGGNVEVETRISQKLAYYKADFGSGVLGPRGWYCFGVYGSGGASLFVTPEPLDTTSIFSGDWRRFNGPVIEIDYTYGGTSGRDSVARVIARVFPKYQRFVQDVLEMFERVYPDLTYGPFPTDKLSYKSDRIVEYRTPGNTEGLGTMTSALRHSPEPIEGVAQLKGDMPEIDLVLLSMRLPSEMNSVKTTIMQQLESETAAGQLRK